MAQSKPKSLQSDVINKLSHSATVQENTWQDQGTHLVKKKLDLYDHLAMAVGPRPDTVTSDNLRSSRSETEFRPYNPGTPVDLATDTPITPIIPQSTGSNVAPTETYDVSAIARRRCHSYALWVRSHARCRSAVCRWCRTCSTSSTSRATLAYLRLWRYRNARHCSSLESRVTAPKPLVRRNRPCLLVHQVSA